MNRLKYKVPKCLFVGCLLLVNASACRTGTGASSAKDVATDSTGNGSPSGVHLYFREGQMISRTSCPDGILVVNYDRAHCTDAKQSVPAKSFYDAISVGVGDGITVHAKNVVDLYTGVTKVQNELVQILAASPSVQTQLQALQHQVTVSETTIAALQVNLDVFDQQINGIRTRLSMFNDIDLNVQLGNLMDERDAVLTKQNQAKTDEQAVRDAFIAANSSSLDLDTLNDVEAQKAEFLQQLHAEQALLTAAMQEVADLNKTIAHVSDASFSFIVLEGQAAFAGLKPFTRRFEAAFAALLVTPVATPLPTPVPTPTPTPTPQPAPTPPSPSPSPSQPDPPPNLSLLQSGAYDCDIVVQTNGVNSLDRNAITGSVAVLPSTPTKFAFALTLNYQDPIQCTKTCDASGFCRPDPATCWEVQIVSPTTFNYADNVTCRLRQ